MQIRQSRRDFLASVSLATAAGVLGARASLADEGPPETTTLRLRREPGFICSAPTYLAEELLRADGFTDIRYVPVQAGLSVTQMIARGNIDFTLFTAAHAVLRLDESVPITVLAGVHPGCFELFVHGPIRTVTDLEGKKVGINVLGGPDHIYLAMMVANVGLDPKKDINWVTMDDRTGTMELFVQGGIDAFLASVPEPQELRARNIGRVILNTTTDQPWSQYLCCMAVGNREFVREHPVATKRYLRAVLKANDICAAEPERTARRLVEGGFTERYDYALQTLTELPYGSWREFDPEDSMRFYGLRLHEVGMIKSGPNALLAEGTDWRFLNELKRELKA
jgi:NitT/TauT family transport system substrate-binding protein